jgi:butyryl-CoA dehydrogenase
MGGYGYTRDFPVEQYWRDNRLNMIHEGTHGIQALDLLGRKVVMNEGAGLKLLGARIAATVAAAERSLHASHSSALAAALEMLNRATAEAWSSGVPEEALANATPYLQAAGHVVIAWIWLDLALAATRVLAAGAFGSRADYCHGLQQACRYFMEYELPKIDSWLGVVAACNSTCRDMREEWFQT